MDQVTSNFTTMQSKQQDAISAANDLGNLMTILRFARDQAQAFVTKYNNAGWSATWAAMATAAQNADGSLGTADATPNTAHPIAVGGIYRSQQALVAGVVTLEQFLNFCGNAAVIQGNYSADIEALVS